MFSLVSSDVAVGPTGEWVKFQLAAGFINFDQGNQ